VMTSSGLMDPFRRAEDNTSRAQSQRVAFKSTPSSATVRHDLAERFRK
jgi:hypothetical protein